MVLVLTVAQDNNLQLTQNNGGAVPVDPVESSTLSAAAPLSSLFYVDAGTATLPADQDGSIGAPFSTLLAAVTARLGVGGTFLIVPGDYSAEVIPPLDGSGEWSFAGLDGCQLPQTAAGVAPTGPPTNMPNLTVAASSPNLVLRSLRIGSVDQQGGANIYAIDTFFGLLSGAGSVSSVVRAHRCYFSGGGVGSFNTYDFDECGFFGSQTLIVADTGICRLRRCYGETSVNFLVTPGQVQADLWTRQQLSFLVLTNCTVVTELQLQNLTASLADPQAQIDDIVGAGVALGFWTDNRVP